jgi:hypothetical protein
MNKVYALIILFAFFVTGCVSTKVTSLVDPAYRDSSYGRILVIGNYDKIELTKLSEKHLVKDLTDSGVFAIANSDLLPPLRKYSDSEIAVIYSKYHLDACIIISQTGEKSEGVYLPGWTNINNSVDYGSHYGGGFSNGTTVTTSVTSTPGSYQKTGYIDTRAELRDIKTGALVSRCETNSETTSYPNSIGGNVSNDYLLQSICEKIVAELRKNKLVVKKS